MHGKPSDNTTYKIRPPYHRLPMKIDFGIFQQMYRTHFTCATKCDAEEQSKSKEFNDYELSVDFH